MTLLKLTRPQNIFLHEMSRSLENLPPTLASLKQHIKRVCYQSNCWNQTLIPKPDLPSPANWGRQKEQTGWEPVWTTLHDHALNLFIAAARKGVLGGVSVSRQPSSALHYVFVLVIINDCCYKCTPTMYQVSIFLFSYEYYYFHIWRKCHLEVTKGQTGGGSTS